MEAQRQPCNVDSPVLEPVEFASVKPENIRLSSNDLGWRPLNFERREAAPAGDCMPGGSTEHLVFVNLAPAHIQREAEGMVIEK